MTPLTHAAVGAALYGKLRARRLTKILAFPLAFVSHYLLDAIPHFEQVEILNKYRESHFIFIGLALVGVAVAGLIWHRNRDVGWIWLGICLWIGLGFQGTLQRAGLMASMVAETT